MPSVAFKEWAVVCRALGEAQQTLILRKGGIAETGGEFRPEFDRFLLYPTYFHEQQQQGIRPEFAPLLVAAEADRPPTGFIRFTHAATVTAVRFVDRLDAVLALEGLHVWTEATVRQRFAYRTPGLYVLTVRVERLSSPIEVPEDPAFAGCKTWVHLPDDMSQDDEPVLSDVEYANAINEIAMRLVRGVI